MSIIRWKTCSTQAAWNIEASWILHRGNVKIGGDLWWPGIADATVLTLAPLSLVLADAAAAAVFTLAPPSLVLAKFPSILA